MQVLQKISQQKARLLINGKALSQIGIVQILSFSVGLLSSKLIAKYISPIEFGEYTIQYAYMIMFHSLFISPIIQKVKVDLQSYSLVSVFKCYLKLILQVYLFTSIIITVSYFLGEASISYVIALIASMSFASFSITTDYFTINSKIKFYSQLQYLYSISNVFLLVLLVFTLSQTSSTTLWTILILSFIIPLLYIFVSQKNLVKGLLKKKSTLTDLIKVDYKKLLIYIYPIMLYAIIAWALSYLDRFILEKYLSREKVGLYSLGYSIGSKIAVLSAPFMQILTPNVYKLKREGASYVSPNTVTFKYLYLFWSISIPIVFIMFILNKEIGLLILSKEYEEAFIIIPIIAFAYIALQSIYYLEVKFYAFGRTKNILIHSSLGVVINILLNFLLIPKLGISGSAIATLLTYIIQCAIAFILFIKKEKAL